MKYGKQLAEKERRTDERGREYTHLRTRTNLKAGNDGVYTVTIPQPPGGTGAPAPVMSVTFPAS